MSEGEGKVPKPAQTTTMTAAATDMGAGGAGGGQNGPSTDAAMPGNESRPLKGETTATTARGSPLNYSADYF